MPFLNVYLAGPYNNCNQKQRTEWRKQIKQGLGSTAYKWIDPVEHEDNWTPMKEIVDIERSDFVIANLWRESNRHHRRHSSVHSNRHERKLQWKDKVALHAAKRLSISDAGVATFVTDQPEETLITEVVDTSQL